MDELLQLLTRMQEVSSIIGAKNGGDAFPFDLPQIVVVGAQSSGKSSVLENLVGRPFLPRGPGIVTRRPLVLQLIYSSKKDLNRLSSEISCPNLDAWGCFLHRPDRRYTRFEDIKQEIITETVRVAGDKFDISSEPIFLKIFSNSVNLTFIDLPGLVSKQIGEYQVDMEKKVRDVVLHYISPPQSLILAVIAANSDVANSECLRMVRQVDPFGDRTLAVITKIDLLDDGSDASDILCGRVVSVHLGVIGVVNRSQRENQLGKSIAEALSDEGNFFKTHYPKLAAKNGTPFLAKTLQCLLIDQIQTYMPELKSTVIAMTNRYQSALKACGEPVLDKGQTLLNIITDYCSTFCSSIKGNSNDLETTELCGGARIAFIFQESFTQALNSINPLLGFNKIKILTAIRNASGTSPGLFIPEASFEQLVKSQIKHLEEPSLQCADLVYQELERVVVSSAIKCTKDLLRFHNLHRKILDISSELITTHLPDTHTIIRQLIEIQMAYINTSHPDFVKEAMVLNSWGDPVCQNDMKRNQFCFSENYYEGGKGRPASNKLNDVVIKATPSISVSHSQISVPSVRFENSDNFNHSLTKSSVRFLDSREHHDCVVIEELIKLYFGIVKKTIQDSVPKAIMFCLVNDVMDNLQRHLVTELYHPENFDELLVESKHISQKRKETSDIIKALDKATEIINEIRDFHGRPSVHNLWSR